MRLAWATDIHLDFITNPDDPYNSARNLDVFCGLLKKKSPDAVILSGDISLSAQLKDHLLALERRLELPIFFVLGNHDFWGSNIESVRKNVTSLTNTSEYLRYLSSIPYIMLTSNVAMVGHDGWYDGLNGNPNNSNFFMNDWNLISDFSIYKNSYNPSLPNTEAILNVCRKNASIAARHVATGIKRALQHDPVKIVIITHVPPFTNPLDSRGPVIGQNLYPWYSSKVMGDMLLTAARNNPKVQFEIFCGHVHSGYDDYVTSNLLLRSGKAEYSVPNVQGFYEIFGGKV